MSEYKNVDVNGNDESDYPYTNFILDISNIFCEKDIDLFECLSEAYNEVIKR